MRYIAFLRGVNVGGHTVKMDRLRALFEEVDVESVRTYIQSGNVLFDAPAKGRAKLQRAIEEHLEAALGYAVPTFLRTVDELEQTLALDPFAAHELTAATRHVVLFASKTLPKSVELPLTSPQGDLEVIGQTKGELFVIRHVPQGGMRNSTFLEKTYGIVSTARFFHTTQKILQAAKA